MRDLPEDERYAVRATQGPALPFVDLRVVNDAGTRCPPMARPWESCRRAAHL